LGNRRRRRLKIMWLNSITDWTLTEMISKDYPEYFFIAWPTLKARPAEGKTRHNSTGRDRLQKQYTRH